MDSDIMHIGQRIRRLRREARLTLLEVASAANLSIGFMSQVERNLTGISISSLVNVAKALNVPLGVLVDQPRQEQPDSHQGARESYSLDDTQQRYERLSTTFNGSLLNAVKVQLLEGYRSEWVAHGGDEFVYVLSGQVSYAVGKKEYLLASGDSLHFDAQQQHRVTNLGDGVAELISVGTLQLFDDDHSVFVSLANSTKPVRAGKVAGKTRPDASVADARKRARDGVEAGAPVDAAKKATNKAARKKSKAPGKQTENVPVAAGASESAIAKKVATPRSRAARVGK